MFKHPWVLTQDTTVQVCTFGFTDLVVLYGPVRDGVDHGLVQVGPANIDRLPNQIFDKHEQILYTYISSTQKKKFVLSYSKNSGLSHSWDSLIYMQVHIA